MPYANIFATNASGVHVATAYSNLGPIGKFDDVFISLAPPVDPKKELAAEQVVHLMDGWRYAASAISALLQNSPSEAIHFSYYAELRAALSLYSGSGIRLKQGDNYYVDNAGNKVRQQARHRSDQPKLRTHTIAWTLWNEWIKRPDANDLVLDGLRLAPSISLRDISPILALFSPSRTIGAWGYDLLSQLTNDHSERNKASYIPSYASKPLSRMQGTDLNVVLALCRLLLPAQSGLTNSLAFDTALIQYLALSTIESKVPDKDADRAIKVAAEQVKFINQLSSATGQSIELINESFQIPDATIFKVFELAAESKSDPLNVLCRAMFLLRLATLSVEKNTNNAGTRAVTDWLLHWLDYSGLREIGAGFSPYDLSDDLVTAIEHHSASKYTSIPKELWTAENAAHTYLLSRPDCSIGWSILR